MPQAFTDVVKQYDYRPPKGKMLLLFALAFGGAVQMAYFALTLDNPRAQWFFGFWAMVAPLGLLGLGVCVYLAFCEGRRVALTPSCVLVPSANGWGLSREEEEIPLTTIDSVEIVPFIRPTIVLRIRHGSGVAQIYSNMFLCTDDFDAFCRCVIDSSTGSSTGAPTPG